MQRDYHNFVNKCTYAHTHTFAYVCANVCMYIKRVLELKHEAYSSNRRCAVIIAKYITARESRDILSLSLSFGEEEGDDGEALRANLRAPRHGGPATAAVNVRQRLSREFLGALRRHT